MDMILYILLAIHVILSLVYPWDWFQTYGRIQEAIVRMVISLFLPLVGVVTMKLVDYFYEQNPYAQMDELYLGRGELTDELQLLRAVDSQQAAKTAPGVDVLQLDNYDERRRMVMNTLRQSDTADYMDVLRRALVNEDRETSHYASVVIMDLQERMQRQLVAVERRLREDPDNPDALYALEEELYSIIRSEVIDENSLPRYYNRYIQVSDELLAQASPSAECFHRRIKVDLKTHDSTHAKETAERFLTSNPDSEDAVVDMINVCVQLNDRAELDKLLDNLGSMPVVLTERSLQYIRYLRR